MIYILIIHKNLNSPKTQGSRLLHKMRKGKPSEVYLDKGQTTADGRVKLVIRLFIPLFFVYVNTFNSQ